MSNVTIKQSWSFVAFAETHGTPKFANCKNNSTGEAFNAITFEKDGEIKVWAHLGDTVANFTHADFQREVKNLKVGLNTSGNYTVYKQGDNAWKTIEIR